MARYAVEAEGAVVGYAGLWSDQKPGFYEFGFAFLPSQRSKGYGTSVVARLLTVMQDDLHAQGAIAYVDDTNNASKVVVQKLGFIPTEEFDDGDRRYVKAFETN